MNLNDVLNIEKLGKLPCHKFAFSLEDDMVRNSNHIGYARSWRQQCFLNHKRNEAKKKLVEAGKEAARLYDGDPLELAFCIVTVCNKTNHRFDPPNFELTEKDLMDGLVQGGVLVDDNSNVIVGTLFRAGESKDRDKYKMTIELFDLKDRD